MNTFTYVCPCYGYINYNWWKRTYAIVTAVICARVAIVTADRGIVADAIYTFIISTQLTIIAGDG